MITQVLHCERLERRWGYHEPVGRKRRNASLPKRVGLRLQTLRRERELTKKDAARLAGISRTYYTGIEEGERNVTLLVLEQLARVFDVPVPSLLAEEDEVERLEDERALRLARLVRFLDDPAFDAVLQVAERFASYSRRQQRP